MDMTVGDLRKAIADWPDEAFVMVVASDNNVPNVLDAVQTADGTDVRLVAGGVTKQVLYIYAEDWDKNAH